MSKEYRKQKNITISPEQVEYVKANAGKMNVAGLSKMLGLTYNKTWFNLEIMGLTKKREGKIVKMDGYFDLEDFAKKYKY